jgi:hypothetical protein
LGQTIGSTSKTFRIISAQPFERMRRRLSSTIRRGRAAEFAFLSARGFLFDVSVFGEQKLGAVIAGRVVFVVDDVAIGTAGDGRYPNYHREKGPIPLEMRGPFP